jgi:hypothetical protein
MYLKTTRVLNTKKISIISVEQIKHIIDLRDMPSKAFTIVLSYGIQAFQTTTLKDTYESMLQKST